MSLHPKQMRTRALAALLALTALTAPAAAQQGGQPLSPRDTARLEIAAGKRVYVDYGRPSMRGRRIVGELVPYGRVWRTGANAATTLVTEADLRIGDALVPRGTYTLYTLPTAQGWTLIVNRQTGQWGTQYEASRDLVRIPMRTTRLAQPVEKFTIALERGTARGTGTLAMAWENTRLTVPVRVQTAAAPRRR
ncbi:MAG TPA: DUF2911 domain-containing protein [Longimicrobium sp.]|jgi:hypothetical protein